MPITFDTGNQNQTVGQIGFFLAPLNPGTFIVPTNFDIYNNGAYVQGNTYSSVPTNFINVRAGFDYQPAQSGGLFAQRFVGTNTPNPQGSGTGAGDVWQNEIACYTTGNETEFENLTAWNGTLGVWNLQPGDTITNYLLIPYGSWIYRTYDSIIDPTAIVAYWRVYFTYNPFSTT